MSNKVFTINRVSKICNKIGFNKFCYFLNRNRKRVIAYHNIIPDKYFDNSLHLEYSTKESNFRKHIEIMKKNFNIGLNYMNPSEITLTFDDGYLNQYTVASKILNENDIKGYFFCAADLILGDSMLSADKISYWISYVPNGHYNLKKYNICINIIKDEDRKIQWRKVLDLVNNGEDLEDIALEMDRLYKFSDISVNMDFYDLRFNPIRKELLDRMKECGHKIGAHSACHKPLSSLSKELLTIDIQKCKSMIGTYYNTKVFCYPFGSIKEVNNEVIKEVKSNGFESAFSFTFYKEGKYYDKFFMPRIELPNTNNEYIIDFILSGAMELIKYKRLLPKIY